jgi:hypothetical protein
VLSPGSARVGLPDSLANPKLATASPCRVLDEAIARQTSKLFSFPVIVLEIYTHDRGSCKFVSFGRWLSAHGWNFGVPQGFKPSVEFRPRVGGTSVPAFG